MEKLYWLVKQEPESYPWPVFLQDKRTDWTGVRNFQARNHLRMMQAGDPVLYYHSGGSREVVGIARVSRSAFDDPTATDGDWSAVELEAVQPLPRAVPLADIKRNPDLLDIPLVRQSRLSVMKLSKNEFDGILAMARG